MHEARSSWILHFVPLPRGSFRMTMMRLCPLRLTMTHPRYCHPESAASGRRIHNTEAAWMHEARSSWILHFVPLPRDSFRMTMMRLCPLRLTMTHPRYCHPESAASGRRIHDTEAAWMHEARSSWILHFVPLPRDSFRMTMMRLCPLRLTSIPSPKCHPERSECQ